MLEAISERHSVRKYLDKEIEKEKIDILLGKIAEINKGNSAKTKNYVVKVTDEDLLKKTGGIVQGM